MSTLPRISLALLILAISPATAEAIYIAAAPQAGDLGHLFHQPVFRASAALVPDDQRVAAAVKLMREVFSYARSRGMGVVYAHEVGTESANPQNILETLPPSALISDGKFKLANPGTPEGYAYCKS